jgi:hypothetical protein
MKRAYRRERGGFAESAEDSQRARRIRRERGGFAESVEKSLNRNVRMERMEFPLNK